jgi:GT2 family glycosyltransferase
MATELKVADYFAMETRRGALKIPGRFNRAELITPTNLAAVHRRRRPGLMNKKTCPMVSVIIPAHNEEAYLGQTLEAINRQHYRNFEIIVIANGCTDRTVGIAEGHCQNLIVMGEKGLSRARNLGARDARGDVLLFLDADTLLEWDALETIAQCFTRQYAAGTLRGRPDAKRLSYRLIYWLKNLEHRWRLHAGSSGVILCWKDDFQAVGGFDERLEVMENSDLIKKLMSLGKYLYMDQTTATTSMRRYQKNGLTGACKLWLKLWFKSLFGDVRRQRYETVR